MSLNFDFSEENTMLVSAVGDALRPWTGERKAELREMVNSSVFPAELWQTFAEIGLMGCLVPEQYGGTDVGLLPLALAFEKIAAMGISPNILLVTCMDSACLARNASDLIKEQYLPGIVSGQIKFCFAITEADAGTNSFNMKTQAVAEGDSYIINGSKTFISGVEVADYMLLVVRTTAREESLKTDMGQYHGLSLFVVPTDAPGIEKQPLPMGFNEGVGQYTLFFDNVEVPANQLVGDLDMGALVMFNSLNPERILAGAMCSGMSENCIGMASEYARERKVFRDTPIGAYQGIAHPLAMAKAEHEAARMMMLKAAWAYDSKWDAAKVGSLANMCKLLNADSAIHSVDVAIETLGGSAFTEEQGLLPLWNGARLLKTAPVSKEMILNFIAEWELGLPKSY
ncbi:MAG: acyl-CoA/acyl-ACP dehydrogenase [Halieaceae bacterium]|mgnify:CR=1 FL=1|jgi:acyl-CoA dehydrogenase|nr:acyl-CoA/acyl-ACP dehydrogenase [Halieaceae bacterium]